MQTKAYFPLFFFISFLSTAHAEIYRWVDEHGRIQFSDRPLDRKIEKGTLMLSVIFMAVVGPWSRRSVLYRLDEQGERIYYSEEQRTKTIEEYEKIIQKNC